MKGRGIAGGQFPGVGGEFRMLLPTQKCAPKRNPMLFCRRFQRLEAAADTEIGQHSAVVLGRLAGGVERKLQNARRRFDWCKGASVHLAENRRAQRVRLKACSAFLSDGNFSSHLRPRRMRCGL